MIARIALAAALGAGLSTAALSTSALAQSYNAPAGIPSATAPGGLSGIAAPGNVARYGQRHGAPAFAVDERDLTTGSIRGRSR